MVLTYEISRPKIPLPSEKERCCTFDRCAPSYDAEIDRDERTSGIIDLRRELVSRAREELGLPEAGADEPVEVEILLGDELRASGQAEVSVGIASAAPARPRGVDLLLAPGLEVGGGELPTESHPEVAPSLAGAGVKATRPLPGEGTDALGLTAARQLLEALL